MIKMTIMEALETAIPPDIELIDFAEFKKRLDARPLTEDAEPIGGEIVKKRRVCVGEEFMTKSHNEACKVVESKYPGLGLKPDGAFMDVANFSAYITEEQAKEHGIDWSSLEVKS